MATKAETKGDFWSIAASSGRVPISEGSFEMPFVPGQIIAGKYDVIELLGVGGVGFVVAAHHTELGEKVALKFLRPEMLAREDIVARFAQEALAAARIKNEHVARVFDVGTLPNGHPYIVMEFLEGRDLSSVVQQDGPQPVKRAVDFVLQACEALAEAHAAGIVHRDVKPENLFLLQRSGGIELIKVLDFGISKVALTGSAFTSRIPMVRTVMPMGSPVYMSPEQIRASKNIDFRTDIWSMGCVLHELLTGKPAFDAPSLTQLSATILEEQPPKISEVRPVVPRELDAIVQRCLEKVPEKRFQSMAELAIALYPYGPRRSRLSAERCCKLLSVEGTNHVEFELPSVRPPGADYLPSGAYPMVSQPFHSSAVGVDLLSTRQSPIPQKKSRRKAILGALAVVSVTVLANVGFYLNSRDTLTKGGAPTNSSALHSASSEQAKPSAQAANNRAPLPAGAESAGVGDSAPAKDSPKAEKGRSVALQRTAPRVAPMKKKSSAANGGSAEPDPGF